MHLAVPQLQCSGPHEKGCPRLSGALKKQAGAGEQDETSRSMSTFTQKICEIHPMAHEHVSSRTNQNAENIFPEVISQNPVLLRQHPDIEQEGGRGKGSKARKDTVRRWWF